MIMRTKKPPPPAATGSRNDDLSPVFFPTSDSLFKEGFEVVAAILGVRLIELNFVCNVASYFVVCIVDTDSVVGNVEA